jgi:hypothetical protein
MSYREDDVVRMVHVCAERGVFLSYREAEQAWEKYSETSAAGWFSLPDDDGRLFQGVQEGRAAVASSAVGERCSKCHGAEVVSGVTLCSACLVELLGWIAQTIHNAHHWDLPGGAVRADECPRSVCRAIMQALGRIPHGA